MTQLNAPRFWCGPSWGLVAWLCLGLALVGAGARAQTDHVGQSPYRKVAPLAKEWQIYDRQLGSYVPFLPKIHRGQQQAHLLAHPDSLLADHLSILGQAGAHLFINRQLAHRWPADGWLHLRLDSVRRLYPAPGLPLYLFTYYQPAGTLAQPPEAYATRRLDSGQVVAPPVKPVGQPTPAAGQERRVVDPRRSYLTVLLVIVLASVAFFSQLSGPLFSWRYVGGALAAFLGKERDPAKRLELGTFVLFMVYYGLAFAYIALFAHTHTHLVRLPEVLTAPVGLGAWLFAFLVVVLVVGVAILAKYWLLLLFANLYNDRNLAVAHIYEFMNLSRLFCTVFVLATLVLNASPVALAQRLAPYLFGAFAVGLLVKGLLVCYRVNKLAAHRSIYLFAYLCSVELIPVLASLKIFVTI